MIAVDTNVVASLFLSSAHSEMAERALEADPEWVAPVLWRSEFRNVLAMAVRRSRLDLRAAIEAMETAQSLMDGGEYEVSSGEVLRVASESRCTAYDSEFVVLASDLGIPLVTLDSAILSAFPDTAIHLEEWA